MSIHVHLRPLTPTQADAIAAQPAQVRGLTYTALFTRDAALRGLRELRAPPGLLAALVEPPPDVLPALTIGRAWDVLHRVLARHARAAGREPLALAILGGTPVGGGDALGWSYDPPTLLDPERVQSVARSLADLDVGAATAHLPAVLAERVYDGDAWRQPGAEDALDAALRDLAAVYARAADIDGAMLRWAT